MSVRLPSSAEYAAQVEKEQYWLPKLRLFLPLSIPSPLVMGKPNGRFPWNWSVYQWIEGKQASYENITDLNRFAQSRAEFLIALQQINTSGGPKAGKHNFFRGGPLEIYDRQTREAILILGKKIDTEAVRAIWEAALFSKWEKNPVWVHGDIDRSNLLVKNGHLSAVIDFGCLCIGDPACDLAIAWTFFKEESRVVFRKSLILDDDTWVRGRGWALWKALIICAGLSGTDPLAKEKSWSVVEQVLDDYKINNTDK
jgi:aminoglycoside phosphotransferase (APT) family kinase protein